MAERVIDVRGASEHNLQDIDVEIGPGLTAVVGVSGSGKSSLAFDTVYHEARRRFLETVASGSQFARERPASVRSITGLGAAVSIAQNVLNRNPASTVASAVGAHPFLRILFSRFATVACPRCDEPVRTLTEDERVREAGGGVVEVPLVRAIKGSHRRLLALLQHDGVPITVDGKPYKGRPLDGTKEHDITIVTGRIDDGAKPADVRDELAKADGWGSPEVIVGGRSLLRSPICPRCGAWVPRLEPMDFRPEVASDTTSHTIAGRTFDDVLGLTAGGVSAFLDEAPEAKRIVGELKRRLKPLVDLGLDHLTLDRPMPTLSRGESQRVRLAVVLAGRLEDLLHVLDEPSIGLHRRDMSKLFTVLAGLPGPVLMVEHDAAAIASADDVIEIGPGPGPAGGRVAFHGTPAELWSADTVSSVYFDGRTSPVERTPREPASEFIDIQKASARNLDKVDCRFPIGRLTAVTGPSGAGKTTLVRDVVLASAEKGEAVGCERFEAPKLRTLVVDQSPIGNNPRSNAATYTKIFDGVRDLFAKSTVQAPSLFTFNRPEGACPVCEGMGAVEVQVFRYIASSWVDCDACDGRRYKPEALAHTLDGLTIADALDLSVDEAREVFTPPAIRRGLDALSRVGLGYLKLGQPSPTLSGGEAQRVRLAKQLSRAKQGDLVVLDEPTTGLHPADLGRLVNVLDGLTHAGCTVIVVEHQEDVVAAADWVVDLGPGGGPDGGRLMHCGPPLRDRTKLPAPRNAPRTRPRSSNAITIRDARANNLKGVTVDIPKGRFTVVTGVSGSGKSSLVRDVVEAEATRRLLECLSMYERQGVREGPEAPVGSLAGLGPTLAVGAERRDVNTSYQQALDRPTLTVGGVSDVGRLVATTLARAGERRCETCGGIVVRISVEHDSRWRCESCGAVVQAIEPRHLGGRNAFAACRGCRGLGTVRIPIVDRVVARPDRTVYFAIDLPLWREYTCNPKTGGYAPMSGLQERYGFDLRTAIWNDLPEKTKRAILEGDPKPMTVATKWHPRGHTFTWPGLLAGLRHWDQQGRFTTGRPCSDCHGKRLLPEYLTIRLDGRDRSQLYSMPFAELEGVLSRVAQPKDALAAESLATALKRLTFLRRVGLGYLHLDRLSATLSAGEAQRVKLASVLGGGLLGMTILLDEPSRGLHPREGEALAETLEDLRDAGNTIVAVEHDAVFLARADHVIEIGPESGTRGGELMYSGSREAVPSGATAEALAGISVPIRNRRPASGWLEVRGATQNNLDVAHLKLPLGVLTGVCGVSGSGKSTLMIDTVGLALAPKKSKILFALEQFEAGAHESIVGAPSRTVMADQSRSGIGSPGIYLGLIAALRKAYADSDEAAAAGLTQKDFTARCDACSDGVVMEKMGFLPPVANPCDVCDGTGYRAETRSITARGRTLPEVEAGTIDQLAAAWGDIPAIKRACDAAQRLGAGYLVVRQPAMALSGGEAQRLKLAHELAKGRPRSAKRGASESDGAKEPTLYLLDEPTVGLHVRDVTALARALDHVVDAGHSVIVVEHDPNLLAWCDWVVELGPGGGPDGGRVIAEGTPEEVAVMDTPTAPYIAAVLR